MNKKLTFTVEVSEELANKISNANYLEGPKYQSYLRELFQESRKNGVSNAQNNNEPLWSFFERFTDASFAHFIRQESWAEFLRDIILDGIDERDEDEILEIINSGCYEDLVSTIMNPYLYDGSYTYNTFKSRWIIADFADQMVIDFDELDSSINWISICVTCYVIWILAKLSQWKNSSLYLKNLTSMLNIEKNKENIKSLMQNAQAFYIMY